jgi:hypothetical protein
MADIVAGSARDGVPSKIKCTNAHQLKGEGSYLM